MMIHVNIRLDGKGTHHMVSQSCQLCHCVAGQDTLKHKNNVSVVDDLSIQHPDMQAADTMSCHY